MSTRRVMGVETEYGITAPGQQQPDPIFLSGLIVRAYADSAGPLAALPRSGGWDYAEETPLQDARGHHVPRESAETSQLTDIDDPTLANSVLSNGARLYVDHAHPEYSSPEVTGPLDAVLYDRAGEVVMAHAAVAASKSPAHSWPPAGCGSTRTTSTARAPPTGRTTTTSSTGGSHSSRS